jgi:hypothetical protein
MSFRKQNKKLKYELTQGRSKLDGIKLKEKVSKRYLARILMSNILNKYSAHYTSADYFENLEAQLAMYYNALNNDVIEVEYSQCSYKYGRVYPVNSLSLCSIRREIRHALVSHSGEDTYVDIDIKACHHVILLQLVNYFKVRFENDIDEELETFSIKLEDYVNNREHWLTKVMNDYKVSRDDAKTLFIIILYNGSFERWAEDRNVKSPISSDLKDFQDEFKKISKFLMEIANKSWYEKMKTQYPSKDKDNKNEIGRFLSIYLQEWERKMLEVMYDYSVKHNLIRDSNCVLCFDGIMLEKKYFDPLHIPEMEKEINDKLGFKITLEVKGFNQGQEVIDEVGAKVDLTKDQLMRFDPDHFKSLKIYEEQKDYFERFICKIVDQAGYIQLHCNKLDEDASERAKSKQETTTVFHDTLMSFKQYNTMIFKVSKDNRKEKSKYKCEKEVEKFFKLWENDENLLAFQTMNFMPKNKTESQIREERINNKDIFNTFTGYSDILSTPLPKKSDGTVDENKVLNIIKIWSDIVLNLCENKKENYDFYINLLSQHIIEPQEKLGIAVIFEGFQGCGKNLHLQPLKLMLGKRHIIETSNIEDILGKHAEGCCNKLFTIINEMEGKDSIDFEGQLKSFVTEDSKVINIKFQRPVDMNNYTMLIITTNKKNVIKIDVMTGNRRWSSFRATDKYAFKNNYYTKAQWKQIKDHWETPQFIACLYYYLTKMVKGNEYKFTNIPQTEALNTLIRQSRPSLYFWLEHYLICKIEQITELEQSPSWKNEPVIIKEGICNFNDKATVLYKDYKEWAEDNKIEHILSNPKWKNEIENLDVGIKMFIDNHLNQNKINFNYKDIYEIFKTKYQNKYVESKEENPLNNLEIETY